MYIVHAFVANFEAEILNTVPTMANNSNYVTEQMFSSRIACHGQITDLSKGFRLLNDQPFSLYIRPKSATTTLVDVLVNVKLYKEDSCSPMPVRIYGWNELLTLELDASNAGLLEQFEIYWGAGNTGIPANI